MPENQDNQTVTGMAEAWANALANESPLGKVYPEEEKIRLGRRPTLDELARYPMIPQEVTEDIAFKKLADSLSKEHKTKREKEEKQDAGLRLNKGKIRYDLFEPKAMEWLAKVFTKGAEKYADRNWEKGMKWSKMEASLMRHFEAYKNGEDYDIDPTCEDCRKGTCVNHTGLLHMAQVAWNAMALISYYHIYPQGDDRRHGYLSMPKIGLDIDEVICDWVGAWTEKFGYKKPENWNFMYKAKEHFDSFSPEELHEFYVNIPAKIKPSDIPFEPHCYITSRSVKLETTQEWILKHGFPAAPIYSIGFGQSKVEVAKKSGIDWFVDDRYENFVELNNAGICTFLLTAPHNTRYNVGYKRINSLKELFNRIGDNKKD